MKNTKIYITNWLMEIGMTLVFVGGVLSGSWMWMFIASVVFVIMSMLRTRKEIKKQ